MKRPPWMRSRQQRKPRRYEIGPLDVAAVLKRLEEMGYGSHYCCNGPGREPCRMCVLVRDMREQVAPAGRNISSHSRD